jgi:hypothetical protein
MDLVSVVVIALVALALIWIFFRAFSHSRHGPTKNVRANMFRSDEGYLYDFGSSGPHSLPPKSGRGDDRSR